MRTRPAACLLLLLVACERPAPPALRVGEVAFGREEVASLAPAQQTELADLAALGQVVAGGETDTLVAPLVRREVERSRLARLPYHLGAERMGIGEEALRRAYAASPEWELEVRHLVRLVPRGATAAQRAEARRTAEAAGRRARAGEDFAALAAELSEEPGAAERGGLLQPGRAGSWVDPFWEAALALEPGEVSPVVETEYGYHVLRLEARRPVPFAQADPLPVLRRLVPQARAVLAMEAWVAAQPPVVLDPPAVLAARAALRAGAVLDTLRLASGYTGRELAADWAALEPEERAGLERADDAGFGRWVEGEAREAAWAARAAELGVEAAPGVEEAARERWRQRVARWGEALGFRPRMGPVEVAAASLAALGARGQEARIARLELPGLRPLLRDRYRVLGVEPGSPSSSEMRKSESTR